MESRAGCDYLIQDGTPCCHEVIWKGRCFKHLGKEQKAAKKPAQPIRGFSQYQVKNGMFNSSTGKNV